jgi:cytochrome P450
MTIGGAAEHACMEVLDESLRRPLPWPRTALAPPTEYRILRAASPVARAIDEAGKPVWLISRFRDVRAILADPRASADQRHPRFPVGAAVPGPPELRSFLRMDPPQHTLFRRLLSRHFAPARLGELRPRVQELVDNHISAMLGRADARGDVLHDLAAPVSSTVLSWVLGFGPEREEWFRSSVAAMLRATDPSHPSAHAQARVALIEIRAAIRETLESTVDRGTFSEDTITDCLVAAVDAGLITMQDAENTCALLVVAGHETTANMAALGIYALLLHPAQLRAVRAGTGAVGPAVDELLRYLTIAQLVVRRVALTDIPMGDETIGAGEGIYPLISSANHDHTHYPEADVLRVGRHARDHLAFGFGAHRCIGHFLARIELEIIIETILRRIPTLRLAAGAEDIRFKTALPTHGPYDLPVEW